VYNEQAGLLLSNYHIVTTLVGHLYVEALRSGLLTMRWPEMDEMIEMHKAMMFGGNLPQSSGEAFIRYTKRMGITSAGYIRRPDCWPSDDLPYK
jgi:hypothetical protein